MVLLKKKEYTFTEEEIDVLTKNIVDRYSRKKFTEDDNEYKNLYIFSLASIILIFVFFSSPIIVGYFNDNFAKNKTIINISKKNFELTLNSLDKKKKTKR